jgi:hypothetical protein
MFGGGRKNNERDSPSKAIMTPDNPPKKSGGGSVTGFDPEGLERAAKAARELDASKNAGAAVELIKTQEVTKQVSHLRLARIVFAYYFPFSKPVLRFSTARTCRQAS